MAKSYYEGDESVITKAGLEPIKAEDLQKKFDAVTEAEYDKQRTELQNTENKFYNKLYDTQQTTMDTIRQNNASAVATGASKGIQAANELSALLGLQQESVEGATDIANQATTIAQDETQAMLENVLNAETKAQEANQTLANILVQSGSVDVEGQNADTAAIQALGTLEAQARADGNVALADYYKAMINNIRTGYFTGSNTSTSGTEEGASVSTPGEAYSKFGAVNTDNTFTTNNGVTGTLDVNTDTITNDKGTYDLSGNLTAYNTKDTNTLYNNLNADGIKTGQKNVIDIINTPQSAWGDDIDQIDFNEDTSKGKAGPYINKLVEDTRNGKIKVGQYVQFNYGNSNSKTNYTYVYVGNGKFAKCIYDHRNNSGSFYVPEGYQVSGVAGAEKVPYIRKK